MLSNIFDKIQVVENFPKPGITFRHIGPLLNDTKLFKYAMQELYSKNEYKDKYDVVCGLDARGFIMSTAIQYIADIGQVMIRKQSKLPGEKYVYEYKKEYGSDILELEQGYIKPGQKVLIVDDLMATAGTLIAAANLVEQSGGIVSGIMVLIEFKDLEGRLKINKLYPNANVYSLFSLNSYDKHTKLEQNIQIKKFRPTVYPLKDNLPVLMWHPTMESFAMKMIKVSNIRPSYVNWDYFPDSWPNITFEPSSTLINKDLIFVMSISIKEIFAEQLALLVALPRQLINSLTIVIPYLGPATHERVDYSGQLATVEPILKILSSCIPMTKTGPPIIRIFDIHALQIRFYTNDNVVMKLMSAIPVLIKYLKSTGERYVIAYPDDGAYKRFKYFFESYSQVVCSKIRSGDTRQIIIRDRINFPEDLELDHVIIIDDLVQSGETLLSCAKALKSLGFKKTSVYATHAVFPNEAWKKFVNNDSIYEFIITNTNPTVSDLLENHKPFVVLDVQKHLCSELSINNPGISLENKEIINVYVASTNKVKLNAVYEASLIGCHLFPPLDVIYCIHSVEGVKSEVPEQPYGTKETTEGAKNRLENCCKIAKSANIDNGIFISIENGIFADENTYHDIPIIAFRTGMHNDTFSTEYSAVEIPKKYDAYVEESLGSENRSVTFGSIIEKKLGITDWHEFVSEKSRKNLIRDSIISIEIK